jgi:hypothetical protein
MYMTERSKWQLAKLLPPRLQQYFATRDPVAAAAYYFALLLFALAPSVVERRNGELHSKV